MCLQLKTWNLIRKPAHQSLTNALLSGKFLFMAGQEWFKDIFFEISRLKLQKLLKSCWPSETES